MYVHSFRAIQRVTGIRLGVAFANGEQEVRQNLVEERRHASQWFGCVGNSVDQEEGLKEGRNG